MMNKSGENVSISYEEIMEKLKELGNEETARIYGNREMNLEIYGVKIADLKKITKKVKKNHDLSLQLYNSGVYDAMYLAGLIADETKMTEEILNEWVNHSNSHLIAEYTVPWVAAESAYGLELGLCWIDSSDELIKAAGWACLTSLVMIKADEDLDYHLLKKLLYRVRDTIARADNREKFTMNGFVIGIAAGYKPLLNEAKEVAIDIGKVKVYMGKTSCKVPFAPEYIKKMEDKGYIGKKRKQARC